MFCKILIILNIVSVFECMDHQYFANDLTNQIDTEQEGVVKRDIERQDRVYVGVNCPAEEFKTIVSLRVEEPIHKNHVCGASLLNKNWGLTAAHCYSSKIRTYYAVTGITTSGDTKPVVSKVSNWYLHKEYKPKNITSGNDIALFRLEKLIDETQYIKYVKLPTKDLGDIRQFCPEGLVKGWGKMEGWKNPKTERDLQCFNESINRYDCSFIFGPNDKFICLIDTNKKSGACVGDSGGPLMCNGIQIGTCAFTALTIVGMACNTAVPQGYIRVDKHLGFINNILETHTPRTGNSPNKNRMSIFMWLLVFFNVFRQFLHMM